MSDSKTRSSGRRNTDNAFTLMEVIGVLAVIAVLAAVLVPKVFDAINNARLGTVPIGIRTIKTAAIEHVVRYNSVAVSNGIPLTFSSTYEGFDRVLLVEGLVDNLFTTRVGTNASIRLVDVSALNANSDPLDKNHPGAYDLDGDGKNNVVGCKYLLEAVIDEPTRADVAGVNSLIDGSALGFQSSNDNDSKGRVVFQDRANAPNPNANPKANKRRAGSMYIYITHK